MYVAGQVGFQLGCPSARGKKQDQRYPGIWGNILREREDGEKSNVSKKVKSKKMGVP